MNETSPYAAPQAGFTGSDEDDAYVPARVIEYLSRTQGWARLISVLVLIFLIPAAVGVLRDYTEPGIYGPPSVEDLVMNLIGGALYIVAAVRLNLYSSAIKRLRFSRSGFHLERSLHQQRIFWKVMAILMILSAAHVAYVLITAGPLWQSTFSRPPG